MIEGGNANAKCSTSSTIAADGLHERQDQSQGQSHAGTAMVRKGSSQVQ
jgi:hypothetical protein